MSDSNSISRASVMSIAESLGSFSGQQSASDIVGHTVNVVSSYLANNKVDSKEVVEIIKNVYNSVVTMDRLLSMKFSTTKPAVPIEESVFDDYIICLEDGKKLKVLKKHLRTSYNESPEEYRAKWKLPADYPMVAPNYAKRRSELAKAIGLGKSKRK